MLRCLRFFRPEEDFIMATKSKIEWTESTWNPVTGCTKISQGCKHCYAETMAKRLQAMGAKGYENEPSWFYRR